MLKTAALSGLFLVFGIVVYKIFFSAAYSSFLIEEGLWIESKSEGEKYLFSSNPLILEKVPGKDLVLISNLKENLVPRLYPLRTKHEKGYLPLNIEPEYPCEVTASVEHGKLKCFFKCFDSSDRVVFFDNSKTSLFATNDKLDKSQDSIRPHLLLVGQIETLNKNIHRIKVKIKEYEEKTNRLTKGDKSSSSLTNSTALEDRKKNLLDLRNNIANQENLLAKLDSEGKELRRISTYGSEVDLASRLTNIEWKILLKKWQKSSQNPETFNSAKTAKQHFPSDNLPGQERALNSPPNEPSKPSWWKEF